MAKKTLLFVILAAAIFLGGCETAKGVGAGIGAAASGAAKDTSNLWQSIQKADKWMRENLW
ncbi:MAG: hypothetical protein WC315_01165 [Candidatus Omnitrophota bacterium]